MEHLTEQDLAACWNERLEPAAVQRALRHLVRGCPSCWTLVARSLPPETPFWKEERPPDNAYDGAIDRAWRNVRKLLPRLERDQRDRVEGLAHLRAAGGNICGIPAREVVSWRLWSHIEIMLRQSQDYRYSKPGMMLWNVQLQQKAVKDIQSWPFGPELLCDLNARVWGDLANAYRVNEKYRDADAAFRTAFEHLDRGTCDPALRARLFDLESSLRRDQQRFGLALELLDEAYWIYRWLGERQLAAKVLMKKGHCSYAAGRPSEAIPCLRGAVEQLALEDNTKLLANANQLLADALVEAGQLPEASRLLLKSNLRQAFANEPLNLLRVRWVEAKLMAGRGRLADAERVFGEVRAGFRAEGLRYDVALAGLDLALVLLKQEKDVAALIREISSESKARGVHPEAIEALKVLEAAVRLKRVTVPLVERVRGFLVRVQHCPGLRFEAAG